MLDFKLLISFFLYFICIAFAYGAELPGNSELNDELTTFVPPKSSLSKDTIQTINKIIPYIEKKPQDDVAEKIVIDEGDTKDVGNVVVETKNKNKGTKDKSKNNVKTTLDENVHGLELEMKEGMQEQRDIETMAEQAYRALKSGQLESATLLYQQILDIQPDNIQAMFALATIYQRSNEFNQSKNLYEKILNIDPQHRAALNNFLALIGEESPEDAILELKKLEAISPDTSSIPAQIASIYIKQNDFKRAAKYFKKSLDIDQGNLLYLYNLAVVYDKAGDFKKAAAYYRRVLAGYSEENNLIIPSNPQKINERLTFLSAK